jgi:GAF domain-containing protein
MARELGHRTILVVPLLRQGAPLGAISLRRNKVEPFSDKQIELVTTFADQAVIAIENTRLFEEVQEKNRALTAAHAQVSGALERETATSEILRVIGSSPTDVQPVFNTIARSGVNVCGALGCVVLVVDGNLICIAATHGVRPERLERFYRDYPIPLSAETDTAQTIRHRRIFHLADIENNPNATATDIEHARLAGYRTRLMVPMFRGDRTLGLIAVTREDPTPFSDQHVELLKTFADQAVIAIENTRLFEAEQASKRELQESLEYQTATSDVLGVISKSPSDVKPVLEAIASTSSRLCQADDAHIFLLADGKYRLAAFNNPDKAWVQFLTDNPITPDMRGSVTGRAVREKRVVQIEDTQADPEHREGLLSKQPRRTVISVPLVREGEVVGAITLNRRRVSPFTERQTGLLETFADQAVIAIENARLFEAEQARTKELSESLEQQTATSEILQVISNSLNDTQPVFDAIVQSGLRLFPGALVSVALRYGSAINAAAVAAPDPALVEAWRRTISRTPLARDYMHGAALLDCRVVDIPDVADAPAEFAAGSQNFLTSGNRAITIMPMPRGDEAIGLLSVVRLVPGPLSDEQLAVLRTFANQAVIAIENTRLLNELRESLQQQTATADVLKVISTSPGNLQPVFRAMLENATRLCEAKFGVLYRYDGQDFHADASLNVPAAFAEDLRRGPRHPTPGSGLGRVVSSGQTVHIADVRAEPAYIQGDRLRRATADLGGARTFVAVPMLKEEQLLGAFVVYRQEVRPFTDKQIDLVSNFARQAVIAIENARLFEEVQARNRDLSALGEVGRAVSSTLDLKVVLKTIVERAVELSGTDGGSIFYFRTDIGRFELGETTGLDDEVVARFRNLDIAAGQTGLGEAIAGGKPLQVTDITKRPSNALRDAAMEAGLRAALIVPLLSAEAPLGALVLQRRQPGDFSPSVVSLMQSFADQSAIALENARLFEEIAKKGRELEIASQHKSQFVANMSHELRTPLAAILGYAELIQEGFYGPLPEKSMDALTRIRSNGKHLLGLINTVLDIAKIESGQFSLNLAEYALSNVVETVRAATESLAETKKIALMTHVPKSLPIGFGDEQRLTQVLLNLVGNAIKFTDSGEVRITAKAENGHFAVSVVDTGPGIPADQLTRVFEQFHQVDSSNTKKKGGTGLGLAIAKQIVEMHGGRVWAESQPGKGATFQLHLPVRAESRKALQ